MIIISDLYWMLLILFWMFIILLRLFYTDFLVLEIGQYMAFLMLWQIDYKIMDGQHPSCLKQKI